MTASKPVPISVKPDDAAQHNFARAHWLGDHRVNRAVLDVGRQAEGADEQRQQQDQVRGPATARSVKYSGPGAGVLGSRNQPANIRITANATSATHTRRRMAS